MYFGPITNHLLKICSSILFIYGFDLWWLEWTGILEKAPHRGCKHPMDPIKTKTYTSYSLRVYSWQPLTLYSFWMQDCEPEHCWVSALFSSKLFFSIFTHEMTIRFIHLSGCKATEWVTPSQPLQIIGDHPAWFGHTWNYALWLSSSQHLTLNKVKDCSRSGIIKTKVRALKVVCYCECCF